MKLENVLWGLVLVLLAISAIGSITRDVVIVTDKETGCDYLRAPSGGITPRLDANGKHVGCRK